MTANVSHMFCWGSSKQVSIPRYKAKFNVITLKLATQPPIKYMHCYALAI